MKFIIIFAYLCPISCAMVKAVLRPMSLLTLQLLSALQMLAISAIPTVLCEKTSTYVKISQALHYYSVKNCELSKYKTSMWQSYNRSLKSVANSVIYLHSYVCPRNLTPERGQGELDGILYYIQLKWNLFLIGTLFLVNCLQN